MEFIEIQSGCKSEDSEYTSYNNTEIDNYEINEREFNDEIDQILQCRQGNFDNNNSCYIVFDNEDRCLSQRIAELDGMWENKTRQYDDKLFTEECGSKIPDNVSSPLSIFLCLISDSLIDIIVQQTNLYCQQSQKPYMENSKEEILKFFGINILMGIKRLPSIRDY